MRRHTNEVLEDHGDWLVLDISTDSIPNAKMFVDKDVWDNHKYGRVLCSRSKAQFGARCSVKGEMKTFAALVLEPIKGIDIDHIEHSHEPIIDNRRRNLRYATREQNSRNCKLATNNKSGVTGVHWDKGRDRWMAYIKVFYKRIHLGRFDTKQEAIDARLEAEKKYFGEFAYTGNHKGE